jgi:hypothetical protein
MILLNKNIMFAMSRLLKHTVHVPFLDVTAQKHPKKRYNSVYSGMALNNHKESNLLLTYQSGAILGE